MNTNVSVVFCTCDKYEDLWDNFFRLFKKYWPEFDGEIVFNTDTKRYAVDGLHIVYSETPHESFAWSNMLAHCLKACTYDKVLIVLDDFYLKAPVDHEALPQDPAGHGQRPEHRLYRVSNAARRLPCL